jgi:cell division protein FtsB
MDTPSERDEAARRRNWTRIAAVVVVTLGVVYVVRFAGQALDTRRAETAERQLATEVAEMEQEVIELETAAARANSDEAVERWAREEGKMARDGDTVVVPVPDADGTVVPPAATETPTGDSSLWSTVRDWFAREPE